MQNWIKLPPPTQGLRVQWQGVQLSDCPKLNNEGFNKSNSQAVAQFSTLKLQEWHLSSDHPILGFMIMRIVDHQVDARFQAMKSVDKIKIEWPNN